MNNDGHSLADIQEESFQVNALRCPDRNIGVLSLISGIACPIFLAGGRLSQACHISKNIPPKSQEAEAHNPPTKNVSRATTSKFGESVESRTSRPSAKVCEDLGKLYTLYFCHYIYRLFGSLWC